MLRRLPFQSGNGFGKTMPRQSLRETPSPPYRFVQDGDVVIP
jgi:hypothetical protein